MLLLKPDKKVTWEYRILNILWALSGNISISSLEAIDDFNISILDKMKENDTVCIDGGTLLITQKGSSRLEALESELFRTW